MKNHSCALPLAKSLLISMMLVVALTIGGCSADAIMGPDEADGPTHQTSTNPRDPEPGNDDCEVGGC